MPQHRQKESRGSRFDKRGSKNGSSVDDLYSKSAFEIVGPNASIENGEQLEKNASIFVFRCLRIMITMQSHRLDDLID
jgi:hypothetical protein